MNETIARFSFARRIFSVRVFNYAVETKFAESQSIVNSEKKCFKLQSFQSGRYLFSFLNHPISVFLFHIFCNYDDAQRLIFSEFHRNFTALGLMTITKKFFAFKSLRENRKI